MRSRSLLAITGAVALLLTGAVPAHAEGDPPVGATTTSAGAPSEHNVIGEALAPALSARSFSPLTIASPTVLTFSEHPIGTVIFSQYVASHGVRFGQTPFIASDWANPTSPVMSGSPQFIGPITGHFEEVGGARYTVDHLSVDVGYVDTPGSVAVTAYNLQGEELITVPVHARGIVTVNVTASGIASFRVATVGSEPAGWAIDNLTFSRGGSPAGAAKYVALGDSFQSGEGTKYGSDGIERPYIAGTDTETNQCHRSDWAYPALLVGRGVVSSEWEFRACSGAVIDDLYTAEVREKTAPYDDRKVQLDALSTETELVTIGIVGNDLGFGPEVISCVKFSIFEASPRNPNTCESRQGDVVRERVIDLAQNELHDKLLRAYRDVRERAPFSRVVVVSYPEFFPAGGAGAGCGWIARPSDQIWMNRAIAEADEIIGNVAREGGFEYVNMSGVLAGHEQCTSEEGLNGIKGSIFVPEAEGYHPNRLGHQLMADRVQAHLGTSVAPTHIIAPHATLTERFVFSGERATVNVAWPGSDVVTTLTSPSGRRYTRDDTVGAARGNGPTWEYYTIETPEAGEWTVEMYGADVDAEGEAVTLTVTDVPPLNEHPEARLSVTQIDADTFRFDGTGSFDTDGSVSEYRWDFGDGTSLISGEVVEHTFPPGEYQVALVVTDDDGSLGFATTDPLLKIEDPRTGGAALTVHSSSQFTNALSMRDDVRVAGDFECNSETHIAGSLTATGSVHLTNNCRVGGDVRAGADVRLDSTPVVGGAVVSGGTVRLQSTATVLGGISVTGDLIVTDGRDLDDLRVLGSLGGEVRTGVFVEAPTIAPDTGDIIAGTTTSWREWVNGIAAANAAPSWSQGLSANPGCVIAPWASSVNGDTITVATSLAIDVTAASSRCAVVQLQSMTIAQSADLVIYADSIASVNGLNVVSADGLPHRLSVIVPGEGGCGSRDISLGAGTTVDPRISVSLRTQGRVTVHGTSALDAEIVAGCFSNSGQVDIG